MRYWSYARGTTLLFTLRTRTPTSGAGGRCRGPNSRASSTRPAYAVSLRGNHRALGWRIHMSITANVGTGAVLMKENTDECDGYRWSWAESLTHHGPTRRFHARTSYAVLCARVGIGD
ncbi:hypothetical protein BDQ17DRAFT_1362345 [Cyathus striatus]|nr:hypothetical protein BDQ17DRAFT_1362345 [Cyathus striatus]